MVALRRLLPLLLLLMACVLPAAADSLRRPSGAVLVPETFLRSWDPVTVFFDGDAGPAKGGPEDHPERLLTMTPAHPGAFTWLDGHTLQFRPAVAWPPMGRFDWTVQGKTVRLLTLMSAPTATLPAEGAANLEPVQAVTLTFRDPIAPEVLARMVTIELRPLPGVGGEGARTLDYREFDVRAMERSRAGDEQRLILDLHHPIGWGTRAVMHLRLTPEPGTEERQVAFSTAQPFHVARFGCRDTSYPALPGGVSYSRERALSCPPEARQVVIGFSAKPKAVGAVEARNLVRFTPPVEDLSFEPVGETLVVKGRFQADTLYQVRLEPAAIDDAKGRRLQMEAPSQLYLSFPARPGFVHWQVGEGIAERFGPQMVPIKTRGVERVDLRIHPIDPLDRGLWPFPAKGVEVDDAVRPPAPGEGPGPVRDSLYSYGRSSDVDGIQKRIKAFGSPSVSELVSLAVPRGDVTATAGLDLAPHLARLGGKGRPGHFLIGIRRLDAPDAKREWMRLQLTDLSFTAIDEIDRIRFAVTSLSTGLPVSGAVVQLQGIDKGKWTVFDSVTTSSDGMAQWEAGGFASASLRRLVVSKDDDVLVLDPWAPPRLYAEGGWRDDDDGGQWLGWAFRSLTGRTEPASDLCHVFTERPIYRPEEPVRIKGYVRRHQAGKLSLSDKAGSLVVQAPSGAEWRYPLEINDAGSIYRKFDTKTTETGTYKVFIEYGPPKVARAAAPEEGEEEGAGYSHRCFTAKFKKEAYRLPRFEVRLNAPLATPLDQPFSVKLNSEYYAGGVVADRPLKWRVTQEAYGWTPKTRPGFVFSADQRFSSAQPFRSTPAISRDERTDGQGGAQLALDPTIEPTAQPRKYVIEATVTGDDDQTVTNTQEVLALPPFVLGLKVARFLEKAGRIEPVVVVEDADGKPIAGQPVTVRLIRRQWNSILQATDFTQGQAKYMTEVIEDKVAEQTVKSGTEPVKVGFPIKGAGVFIVEVESRDRLGRLQTVKVDLFAGGERPATWSKPPAEVFSVAPDKTAYAPGETAKLVLQSPFQSAQALAVVEEPDGHNRYQWVEVKNGYGTFPLEVKPEYLPRIPVHFVLMRGRLKGDDSAVTVHADLRKPATLAATEWVAVTPVKNIVKVDLDYPAKAQPGQQVDLTVKLSDDQGKPLAGEVTLWMVDQAVLALAREAKLDPLPQFIKKRPSTMTLRDTRNLAFGLLPLQEEPGGDEGEEGNLLQKISVRRNFTPVPYYEPSLRVGAGGTVTVKVTLPDSLTNFKLRAKAVSGPSRFGFGTGTMQVRLPVLVQPALPRFVRPGDSFQLSGIGRVVDGVGGPGRAALKLDGLKAEVPVEQGFDFLPDKALRLDYPVKVTAQSGTASVTLGVQRLADESKDAFQVDLPVLPDRDPVVRRAVARLDGPVSLPAITEPLRPETVSRTVMVGGRELVALAAGLDYLRRYPFGCTEQRISLLRADIGAKRFGLADGERLAVSFPAVQQWLASSMSDKGLVSYWPGGQGYVSLTAWAVESLVEARAAGLTVDQGLFDKLTLALKQSLRSDYTAFIDGESWSERTLALAALTDAGQGDAAYGAELARKANVLRAESLAQVALALARAKGTPAGTLDDLQKKVAATVITKLDQGREVYGGLQENGTPSPLVLPSESRTVAQVLRASLAAGGPEPRNRLLADALIGLGRGDGWGSTNANAEALLALADWLGTKPAGKEASVTVSFGEDKKILKVAPAARTDAESAAAVSVTLDQPSPEPLAVWTRTAYMPVTDGSTVASAAQGLAVDREAVAAARVAFDKPGVVLELAVGQVVEDHVTVVVSQNRAQVAVTIPLAAGAEPLNPALATAPPEAKPSEGPTRAPTYVAFLDDRVSYFYDLLPKGTYHFRVRSRATIPGRFIQPAASAQAMYDDTVNGNGNGAVVVVTRP